MIPLPDGPVPATADAVVVGGGINGLAAAYELARRGLGRVVLLERGYLGGGSTGRCGGGIRQQWTTRENVCLARESVLLYEELAGELGYQTFFRQGGYLMVSGREEDREVLRRAVALQRDCGVPSRFLEPDECRRLVPGLEVGGIRAATFCPSDGTAYPFSVTWGYARAARRRGVRVFLRTELRDVRLEGGRVVAVATSRGDIATPVLVNCAGPWARQVAGLVGVELPNRQERHEIMVSESLKPCLGPMVISITSGIYFSQGMRGEIVGGIGDPEEPRWSDPRRFATTSGLRFAVRFARELVALWPPARHLRLMRQWAGLYDVTPDHRPILGGAPRRPGYYHICGFSGHGFMLGPVCARKMAAFITDGRPDEIIDSLSLERFDRGDVQPDAFVVG